MAFSADFLVLYATKPYPIDSIAPRIPKNTFNSNHKDVISNSDYFVNKVCKLARTSQDNSNITVLISCRLLHLIDCTFIPGIFFLRSSNIGNFTSFTKKL